VGDEATQKEVRALAAEYERLAQYVDESVEAAKSPSASDLREPRDPRTPRETREPRKTREPGEPRAVRRNRAKESVGRPYACSTTKPDNLRPASNGRWCRTRRSD
jgi:hypothetical protein